MAQMNYSTTRMLTTKKPHDTSNSRDAFEFPPHTGRKGEGGLRKQGFFKNSFPDKPLVSIITVVYNGAETLEKTVESVLDQTYDNVEYIIIDGGSTDGTLDVIKKYENGIDYWISEPDKGIYDAMNKGISQANGDFVNFMNAGDAFADADTLSDIFENAQADGDDLIYGPYIVVDHTSGQQKLVKPKAFTRFNLIFWMTRTVCHQAMFVHKSVLTSYPLEYRLKGELYWYFDLCRRVRRFRVVDRPVVHYRMGGVGDTYVGRNALEALRVTFRQNGLLGVLSLPILVYRTIRKALRSLER
jgi:glycosyltransferase involved in cell wall biosynthesis